MPRVNPNDSGTSYTQNPDFDPRIRAVKGVGAPTVGGDDALFRGRLESKSPVNGAYRRLQFLYNPSDITWQGNIDVNIVGNSAVKDPTDTGKPILPMSQNVSFMTMFDRTYETWEYNESKEASRTGVLCDIKNLYALLGILGTYDAAITLADTASTLTDAGAAGALANSIDLSSMDSPSPTSFMQYVPVTLTLGTNLNYYGVIQTATVHYTHFTQRMIPNRCSVEFGMQLLPWVPEAAVDINMPSPLVQGSLLYGPGGSWLQIGGGSNLSGANGNNPTPSVAYPLVGDGIAGRG